MRGALLCSIQCGDCMLQETAVHSEGKNGQSVALERFSLHVWLNEKKVALSLGIIMMENMLQATLLLCTSSCIG